MVYTVSVLEQDKGNTVKFIPLPKGVPEGIAQGNFQRLRAIFYRIS